MSSELFLIISHRSAARKWMFDLQAKVRRELGIDCRLVLVPGAGKARGASLGFLEALERRVLGECGCGEPAQGEACQTWPLHGPSRNALCIDLTGHLHEGQASILRPIIGDQLPAEQPAETPARPSLSIRFDEFEPQAGWRQALNALIAVPDYTLLSRRIDTVCANLGTILFQLVRERQLGIRRPAPLSSAFSGATRQGTLLGQLNAYVRRVARKFTKIFDDDDWTIAYKFNSVGSAFKVLTPPRNEFWADPFPFTEQGKHYIFFENYEYRTQKGKISYVTSDDKFLFPRDALVDDIHLSYPCVFREGDAIYMIPETSIAREVRLYRSISFPSKWVLERVLISGRDLADATLHRDTSGYFWLFATEREPGTSGWDRLAIFHAASLHGPWIEHRMNPIKIDATSARPAGPLFYRGGKLVRPAQDCSAEYGGAMYFCVVDELNPATYREHVECAYSPEIAMPHRGPHTFAKGDGLSVIDIKRRKGR